MYIKPTQSLWSKIESKIQSMLQDRLKYAADWFHYGTDKTTFERLCIVSVIPPNVDKLVQELGGGWFNSVDTFEVRIHNGTAYETYALPAKAGGRAPLISPHWNHYSAQNRPIVEDPVIKEIARRRHEAYTKISVEQKEFLESVKKVWEDAPSVNALAKIWPPIIDLLPADVVQSLEKKTTRRTAKQMAQDIDTKSLSVKILKAKVAE